MSLVNPAAGTYTIVVDGYAVPAGTTEYDYRDVYFAPSLGTVKVDESKPVKLANGASAQVGAEVLVAWRGSRGPSVLRRGPAGERPRHRRGHRQRRDREGHAVTHQRCDPYKGAGVPVSARPLSACCRLLDLLAACPGHDRDPSPRERAVLIGSEPHDGQVPLPGKDVDLHACTAARGQRAAQM